MKTLANLLLSGFLMTLFISSAQSQAIESTYNWFTNDHSAWKVQPNFPEGYVLMGNKFFEPANNSIYAQGFDEKGAPIWLGKYTPTGFSSFQTFWKSFTLSSTQPVTYFAVVQGQISSASKAYALLIDGQGNKIWDRISDIPTNIQFGGVTHAKNGGWIATGGNGDGKIIAVKFDSYGKLQWFKNLDINGLGWTIISVSDGGYLIGSTNQRVTKIDNEGNQVWTTSVQLPLSPDGSAYSYSEFEELVPLPAGNDGVIITGSTFSNSHSSVYSARVSYSGAVAWKTVHSPSNTSLAGTPVSWINNAIVDDAYSIVTSWRKGPVSTGGTLFYQRQNYNGGLINAANSMNNTIPVQEAFFIKAHNKYIVGGTRGSYTAAYSWIHTGLPVPGRFRSVQSEETQTLPSKSSGLVQINRNNTKPVFEYHPASRVFNSELRIFPNPSTGIINVGGNLEQGSTLRVTDILGRVVLEKRVLKGKELNLIDLTGYGKGIFNFEIKGSNQTETKKVLIQ